MGVVYEALDPLIERKVAIKTIRMDLSAAEREQFEERFFREAKSAGQLIHPNIVTIFDAGKSDDLAYIAMEVLAGPNLRDLLDKQTPITPSEIANITAQAAEALAFAHERGIVHRDIKPGNIVLLDNRHVKIADFGIAQLPSGSRTLAGTVLGSPKYMSPEQITGADIDGRSDIFSLGVVLYEMLTGEPPFSGDSMSAIMYQVINTEPPAPTKINPRLPTVFNSILTRALSKKPEQRYTSAREMARELREAESMLTISPMAPITRPSSDKNNGPTLSDATLIIRPDPTQPGKLDATLVEPPAPQPDEDIPSSQPEPHHNSKAGKNRLPLLGGITAVLLVLAVVGGTAWWISQRVIGNLQPVESAPLLSAESDSDKPVSLPSAHTQSALPDSNGSKTVAATKPTRQADKPAEKTAAGSKTEQADKPATKEAKQQPATVTLSILPWGEIYVDGELKGVSPPMVTLSLPAGKHTIEVRNTTLPTYTTTVTLKDGEKRKIRHRFE